MSLGLTRTEGPPNKGMKLTKPERIGALQLIPGVRLTRGGAPGSTDSGNDARPATRMYGEPGRN